MRLHGFHVIWHPDLGIYLGEGEPEQSVADLPFARHVWSTSPNLLLSAPVYRSQEDAVTSTEHLPAGWVLRPILADLIVHGRVFASMLACMEAGLPPWMPAFDYRSDAYCRSADVGPLVAAIESQLSRYQGLLRIEWEVLPIGLRWGVYPTDPAKTEQALIARDRQDASAYWH
ncbi:hypothetical protein FNB15_03600 [Ferrovibrio terrae]|uniref:Uncharacterized protein n=1 Tax=Ferrovibrio terrae TaxID=2594003 RepID=A0A516GY02_9PROT|nr:hypothetical protein [Ferrovibrio terrae]QDO96419.1 hypothetical protein FNB15_03600 [Ferrovibrio terrae]